MKSKLLCGFLYALAIVSCVGPKDVKDENGANSQIAQNLVTTQEYKVPVKEGYTTIVTYNGQRLAVTSDPITILIPKEASASSTKAADDSKLFVYFEQGTTAVPTSTLWQTIAFEDSKSGDFDYNDLIIHSKYVLSGSKLSVSVHPIALGSTNEIKLGFVWRQGDAQGNVVVANSCRADLFDGAEGFINTEKYNRHFDSFAKILNVDVPNSTDPVYVTWYIYSSGKYINAVNKFGKECVDDDGNPFGLVITDAGITQQESAGMVRATKSSASDWNSMVVSAFGTFPEVKESDYTSLPDMSTYATWGDAANKNYHSPATGSYNSFNGDCVANGNSIYVSGTMTITNYWGNKPMNIYVLDGGKLFFNINSIQKVNIYLLAGGKFASVANNGKSVNLSTGTKLMAVGDLNMEYNGALQDLQVENGALLWVGNRLNVNTLNLTGTAASQAKVYAGCCIYASESVEQQKESYIYINSYLNTPQLIQKNGGTLYVKSGALMDVTSVYQSTNKETKVECIGAEGAIMSIKTFKVEATLDYSTRLVGKLYIHYDSAQGSWGEGPTVGAGVTFNNPADYLPENACHPAFGKPSGGDSGACWFSYPLERNNIRSCYNFESWKSSNFNFTILDASKVFDITNTKPVSGSKVSIYTVTE